METVVRKAYAKVNLGLDVTGRRPDGYHELRTIMQTVDLYDEITLEKLAYPDIRIRTDCHEIPTDARNLMYRAAADVQQKFRLQSGVLMTLRKQIPVAAGMAGGSTDAAAVFHGLNQLFRLEMTMEEMCDMGVRIGADIPYCIQGGTVLAEGIGEQLTVLPALSALPDVSVLILKPNISISTRWVYERLDTEHLPCHPDIDGMTVALRAGDMAGIIRCMGNVLETVTAAEYPIINELKTLLIHLGANGALMSGSGPSVFGIFSDVTKAARAYDTIREKQGEASIFLTTFH